MNDLKLKIEYLVKEYKRLFIEDYEGVVRVVKWKRNNAKTKFNEMKGVDTIDRAVVEWPENLWVIMNKSLTDDEMKWLRSKVGIRWFAKKFKEFSLSKV